MHLEHKTTKRVPMHRSEHSSRLVPKHSYAVRGSFLDFRVSLSCSVKDSGRVLKTSQNPCESVYFQSGSQKKGAPEAAAKEQMVAVSLET